MEHINEQKELEMQEEQKQKMIQSIKEMEIKELIEFLKQRHLSECYLIIRDIVTDIQKKSIRNDDLLKIEFKEIQNNAKNSWDNDHRHAMILDVNATANQLYNHLSNLIMQVNNDLQQFKAKFNEMFPVPVMTQEVVEDIFDPEGSVVEDEHTDTISGT